MTIGKPFQSGNHGGRPKMLAEVQELAGQHTTDAVETLVSIMRSPKVAAAARVSAANALLDRGYGKAPQHQHITGEGGPQFGERMPNVCATVDEWVASIADTQARAPNGITHKEQ